MQSHALRKKWNVCVLCINVDEVNKRMYNNKQCIAHNKMHIVPPTPLSGDRMQITKTPSSTIHSRMISTRIDRMEKINPVIHKYIEYYKALENEKAMEYVVNKQYAMQNNITTTISPTDAQLHTLIASVALNQSKNENRQFAKLLQLIKTTTKNKTAVIQKERDFYR